HCERSEAIATDSNSNKKPRSTFMSLRAFAKQSPSIQTAAKKPIDLHVIASFREAIAIDSNSSEKSRSTSLSLRAKRSNRYRFK
ncbi:MAG: hypothetical protein ACRC62_21700, partial [Microcoleus sp.]